mmetsp:Transcript_30148/g.93577  ORF Transcript_30148/g.93577 Transcript_30148/m.93577 type:complete len:211 (-) Transcript_30148:482-1114(-)
MDSSGAIGATAGVAAEVRRGLQHEEAKKQRQGQKPLDRGIHGRDQQEGGHVEDDLHSCLHARGRRHDAAMEDLEEASQRSAEQHAHSSQGHSPEGPVEAEGRGQPTASCRGSSGRCQQVETKQAQQEDGSNDACQEDRPCSVAKQQQEDVAEQAAEQERCQQGGPRRSDRGGVPHEQGSGLPQSLAHGDRMPLQRRQAVASQHQSRRILS